MLVLVDGEHYPPVVRRAIDELRERPGRPDVAGAVMLGGTEKVRDEGAEAYGVEHLVRGDGPVDALCRGIEELAPDLVVDVSGSPVVDARSRMLLAAHALVRGVDYEGADFRFEAPPRPRVATKPSIAVAATAKRSGKTAIAGHLARLLVASGRSPVVVAMGRGGPPEPEVIEVGTDLSPTALLALASSGRHAASDHLEDALMSRVPTVGTLRAGGGMAGGTVSSTFARGVELANERDEDFLVLEGSGAAIPPVAADTTVCAVPAGADPELVAGYLGPFVLLLADLVVITLAPEPLDQPGPRPGQTADALEDRIRELVPGTPVVRTTFRPHPLEPISGRTVFFATTAPPAVAGDLAHHLEVGYGARVVGWSANLADRRLLTDDLSALHGSAEVLVTELKAAAVDVATKVAIEGHMDVVYCDNRPVTLGGDADLDEALVAIAAVAEDRFRAHGTA